METKNETDYIEQFGHLLRYFVVHLEHCHNEGIIQNMNWWGEDEKEYAEKIKKRTGQGYNDNEIQKQINLWCNYPVGKVCISVQSSAHGGYQTKASYLHWYGTGLNINAEWEENKIKKLYFRNIDENQETSESNGISRDELFGSKQALTNLYNEYVGAKKKCLSQKIKELSKLLENNYNLILTGAPGTGKTYMTESITKSIMGVPENKDVPEKQYCFVQFHPSYDYTDFVEGLRPIKSNGQVVFERTDGIFKEFCAKAAKDTKHNYVFVIDEINRGEISKIFGELFFSIDPGYREGSRKMKTQYHNLIANDNNLAEDYPFKDGFFVPKNVFIIGTMNDIDRSVESMDFAFRRRFSFAEVTASESESMIYSQQWESSDLINEAISRMQHLNEAIVDPKVGNLTQQFQIGGAYFLKIKKYYDSTQDVSQAAEQLWNYHLKGILYEYFRGEPDAEIKMKQLKVAYDSAK